MSDRPSGPAAALGKPSDWQLIRRVWDYVLPHRVALALSGVLTIVGVVATLVQPVLLKAAIDDHIAADQLDGLDLLALGFIAVVAVGFPILAWGFGAIGVTAAVAAFLVGRLAGNLFLIRPCMQVIRWGGPPRIEVAKQGPSFDRVSEDQPVAT